MSEIEELKAQIAALQARVKALEPPPPMKPSAPTPHYDPTEGMSMPASAMRDLMQAVPDRLLADIVGDHRGPQGPRSMASAPEPKVEPKPRGTSGWIEQAPLGPVPGIRYVDQLMDAADAADRVELARRLGRKP